MRVLGIIPARLASTRFPEKPLVDIGGKTMVRRVWEQARQSDSLVDVVVATDHERIANEVTAHGGTAIMTRPDHPSGTDRCREALEAYDQQVDYVINIQGDEPFIVPAQLDLLAALLDGHTELATLVSPITDTGELDNTGVMKVIVNQKSEALYFSRTAIPHLRDVPRQQWLSHYRYLKHVALYAYRADVLRQVTQLPQSALEQAESLEQLRWLEAGYTIRVAETSHPSISIDTPEDLARAKKKFGLED